MARVGRLAGAIVVETGGRWFLVGNPKEPCDFARAGFQAPGAIDAAARPVVALCPAGAPALAGPIVHVALEGDAAAALVAERLLIARNGSVSERLWRLITDEQDGELEASWLTSMPARVWNLVRDTVLRCS